VHVTFYIFERLVLLPLLNTDFVFGDRLLRNFETVRFDLALVARLFGVAPTPARFVVFPRTDFAGLRALRRVADFPLRINPAVSSFIFL
jgi:hypothetical protein